jgi:hypothetical protein
MGQFGLLAVPVLIDDPVAFGLERANGEHACLRQLLESSRAPGAGVANFCFDQKYTADPTMPRQALSLLVLSWHSDFHK